MAINGEADDFTPVPTKLGHEGNLPLARALGNYVLEARQHTIWVRKFYEEVLALNVPASAVLEEKILGEFERHHAADADNLVSMKSVVA